MSSPDSKGRSPEEAEIRRLSEKPSPGLLRELLALMAHQKKWWLIPVLAVLLAASFLLLLAQSGAAPFLYALF